MKYLILILIILTLSLSSVSAIKISVSPAHIYLSGKTNTNICKKITISSDKEITFYGEDRWSLRKGESFASYKMSSKQINLTVKYQKEITSNAADIDFCVKSENSGNFYGIIFFKTSDSIGGIGSRVNVEVIANPKKIKPIISLSGIGFALLLTLALIILYGRKRNNNYL